MRSDRDRLVDVFFAPPNQLRLEDINEQSGDTIGDARRLLNQLIEDARVGDNRPVLLPRIAAEGTVWYALMPDRRLRQMIAEDIRSFVGPTYADLKSMADPLDGQDPIDAAALDWIGNQGAALRFTVPAAHRRAATVAIAAMRQAWDKRPRHLVSAPDGTAIMLRALNRAIASGDSALAEIALDRVRSSGRLSSANLTFASIRVLEVGARWAEILDLDEIGVVLAIPRPRAVTEALLRAVYWTQIADAGATDRSPEGERLDVALERMRDAILPRYAALFRAVDGFRTGEALLLFALRAAVAVPPRLDEIEHLAQKCEPDDPARSFIEAVGQHVRRFAAVEAPPSSAESAFAVEAVKAELARTTEASQTRIRDAQGALETFGRGASLETAVEAYGVLSRLTPEENAELGAIHRYDSIAARLRALVPPGASEIPGGWVPWAIGLRTAPEWSGASDALELAAGSWTIDPLLGSAAAEDFALAVMEARSQGGRDPAAKALDHLVPAAEAAVARGLNVVSLGSRLVTVLLADDIVTEADWNFIVALLDVVLEGIDRARYSEILDEVRSTLVDRSAPAMLDASIATLEVAAFHAVPDPSALNALAGVVIGICERFAHRMHRDQLSILEMACRDLGGEYETQARVLMQQLQDGVEGANDRHQESLDGQLIGIYSLEEAAALRAKVAIETAYTGVRVETNASKIATQGLRRLAQTADQMIVVTRAAKHAATIELDSILRRRALRPIFPAGKGATSMVRALRERVADAY